MPYANTEAMQKHLEEISWVVAENAHAALLMDGAGWHKAKELNHYRLAPVGFWICCCRY